MSARSVPRLVAFTLAASLVVAGSRSSARGEPPLAGLYRCDGVNAVGQPYHGVAVIAAHGDTYRVQWRIDKEPATFGLGIRHGDLLAVSYFGSAAGIIVYEIADDRLTGRWTVFGAGGAIAHETLTPTDDPPAPASESPGPQGTGTGFGDRV